MSDSPEQRLRAAIKIVRKKISGNTLHAAWEAVFDAEALLDGRPTILTGEQEELMTELTTTLEATR